MKTRVKDKSIPLYSPQSHANSAIQPGSKLLTSATAAWRSALLEVWQQPSTVEEFTTVSTPDQVIVFTSAGHYEIESYAKGGWRTARYQPGKGGATAPFNTSRLRWRSGDTSSITTLHLYLPHEFLLEAGEEYRRAGSAFAATPVDFLSMDDPQIYQVLRGLARGVEMSAPDLYCDAACRMLAIHLLLIGGRVKSEDLAKTSDRNSPTAASAESWNTCTITQRARSVLINSREKLASVAFTSRGFSKPSWDSRLTNIWSGPG